MMDEKGRSGVGNDITTVQCHVGCGLGDCVVLVGVMTIYLDKTGEDGAIKLAKDRVQSIQR